MIITVKRRKSMGYHNFQIDEPDLKRVGRYKWWVSNGYVVGMVDKQSVYLHRFIMNTPKGMVTDHINGDKLDNRRSNLRVCKTRENVINCRTSKNNTSGHRGVSWKKDKNKYKAYLMVNRRQIHLGYYDKIEEAIQARVDGEIIHFGRFAPSALLQNTSRVVGHL